MEYDRCKEIFTSRCVNAKGYRNTVKKDPCVYCGGKSTTFEHVLPRKFGGRTEYNNVVGACQSCNNRKGHTGLLQFLLSNPVGVNYAWNSN